MTDATLLARLAHPARRAALEQIATGPTSPEAIARDVGMPLGVIAYHVRSLAAAGLIELDHEERVRGAVRHVYRLAPINGLADDVAQLASDLDGLALALATPGPTAEEQIDALSRAATTPWPPAEDASPLSRRGPS